MQKIPVPATSKALYFSLIMNYTIILLNDEVNLNYSLIYHQRFLLDKDIKVYLNAVRILLKILRTKTSIMVIMILMMIRMIMIVTIGFYF